MVKITIQQKMICLGVLSINWKCYLHSSSYADPVDWPREIWTFIHFVVYLMKGDYMSLNTCHQFSSFYIIVIHLLRKNLWSNFLVSTFFKINVFGSGQKRVLLLALSVIENRPRARAALMLRWHLWISPHSKEEELHIQRRFMLSQPYSQCQPCVWTKEDLDLC